MTGCYQFVSRCSKDSQKGHARLAQLA